MIASDSAHPADLSKAVVYDIGGNSFPVEIPVGDEVITRHEWLSRWLESRDAELTTGAGSGNTKSNPLKYIPHSLISFVDDSSGKVVLENGDDGFEGGKEYRLVVKYRPEFAKCRTLLLEVPKKPLKWSTMTPGKDLSLRNQKTTKLLKVFEATMKEIADKHPEVGLPPSGILKLFADQAGQSSRESWHFPDLRIFFSELLWQEFHGGLEEYERILSGICSLEFPRFYISFLIAGVDARWLTVEKVNCSDLRNISDLSVAGDALEALGTVLQENSSIQELNLGFNCRRIGIDGNAGAAGFRALGEVLKKNTSIQKLNLSGIYIHPDAARELAAGLSANSTLLSLNLERSELGYCEASSANRVKCQPGMIALAEGLKGSGNSILRELKLCSNGIRDDGAKALAKVLKGNSTLQKLDLSYNHIEADGTKALAEALKGNSTLQELDLFDNIIVGGVHALAEALKQNTGLLSLDLSGCRVSDSSARVLAEGLKENSTLQKMNLSQNRGIRYDTRKIILACLKKNSK